jgi:hypothetical protein
MEQQIFLNPKLFQMKRKFTLLPLLIFPAIALFSFVIDFASGIKGTISPAENAGTVWAIAGKDSLKATPVQGAFQINDLKAGTYKVVVEAKAPYKNFVKEGVAVKDGAVLDLGTITLSK